MSQPVRLDDPRDTAAAKVIEATFKPQNGQLLVRYRPISSSVIVAGPSATATHGDTPSAPTIDYRFDVVAASDKYWSATAGKHLPVPIKAGDVVACQGGSWVSFPQTGWKNLAVVYWEHVLGVLEEGPDPRPGKAKPKAKTTKKAEEPDAPGESVILQP